MLRLFESKDCELKTKTLSRYVRPYNRYWPESTLVKRPMNLDRCQYERQKKRLAFRDQRADHGLFRHRQWTNQSKSTRFTLQLPSFHEPVNYVSVWRLSLIFARLQWILVQDRNKQQIGILHWRPQCFRDAIKKLATWYFFDSRSRALTTKFTANQWGCTRKLRKTVIQSNKPSCSSYFFVIWKFCNLYRPQEWQWQSKYYNR